MLQKHYFITNQLYLAEESINNMLQVMIHMAHNIIY